MTDAAGTPSPTVPVRSAWIVDTSPFIGLAKLDLLDLLAAPTRDVFITEIVQREVLSGSVYDAAQRAMPPAWVTVVSAPTLDSVDALSLDAGEASVLSVALSLPGSVTIIDEIAGRKAAKLLGVSVVGTVGVLLQARRERRISTLVPELRRLQSVGLYLPSDALLASVAASVGESWPEN